MLKGQDITVGKCYVDPKGRVAREVVEELDRHRVRFNAFNLITGRLIPAPFQISWKSDMARWAGREASPEELARIHPFEPIPWFEDLPISESKAAKLEFTKANMLETVKHNTIQRC